MPNIDVSEAVDMLGYSLHQFSFCYLVEIDHHVAAEDHVELLFEWVRISHQIEPFEQNHLF